VALRAVPLEALAGGWQAIVACVEALVVHSQAFM
jgi:hypothetical protein